MNVNEKLIALLKPLGIPVKPDVYRGDAEEYIEFNYADERSILSADDLPIMDETTLQIHLYTKNNPIQLKKQIRRLLRLGGFIVVSSNQIYENDSGYSHVVITASIESVTPAEELPEDEEEY